MQSWTPASQQKLSRGMKSLDELGDVVTAMWSACLPVSAGVLARSASSQECAKARQLAFFLFSWENVFLRHFDQA